MSNASWFYFWCLILVICLVAIGMTAIANHAYPHGPSYPTGEIAMPEGGRWGEIWEEDVEATDNPAWVKFFKKNDGIIFFAIIGSVIALIAAGDKWQKMKRQ